MNRRCRFGGPKSSGNTIPNLRGTEFRGHHTQLERDPTLVPWNSAPSLCRSYLDNPILPMSNC